MFVIEKDIDKGMNFGFVCFRMFLEKYFDEGEGFLCNGLRNIFGKVRNWLVYLIVKKNL